MNLFKDLKNLGSHKNAENWYITLERAEGVEDKDRWSKSDTYAVVNFGGQHIRTHTINNNRTPFWNETFNLKIDPENIKDLHIKLMDDDFGPDDSIGSAVISKEDLPVQSGDERYLRVPVFRKEQTTGIIILRVKKFNEVPTNIASSNLQQQNQPQGISSVPYQSQQGLSSNQPQQFPSSTYSQQLQSPQQQQQQQQPLQQQQQPLQQQQQPLQQQQQPLQQQIYPQQQLPQQQQQIYPQQQLPQQQLSQQQQPIYSQKEPTTYSHHHRHHHEKDIVSSTQPFSTGSGLQTNYEQDQQNKF